MGIRQFRHLFLTIPGKLTQRWGRFTDNLNAVGGDANVADHSRRMFWLMREMLSYDKYRFTLYERRILCLTALYHDMAECHGLGDISHPDKTSEDQRSESQVFDWLIASAPPYFKSELRAVKRTAFDKTTLLGQYFLLAERIGFVWAAASVVHSNEHLAWEVWQGQGHYLMANAYEYRSVRALFTWHSLWAIQLQARIESRECFRKYAPLTNPTYLLSSDEDIFILIAEKVGRQLRQLIGVRL